MSLPTTISLYLSSLTGTDIDMLAATVFELDLRADKGVSYYSAPSPQGDVAGKPKLKVSQKTSRNGILNTRFEVTVPVFDADTGTYPSFTKDGWFSTRQDKAPIEGTVARMIGLATSFVAPGQVNCLPLVYAAADGDL
jgi:hypothetical protein